VSPRKSSTSSGKPPARSRYLGIEVLGDRTLSARGLEQILVERLRSPDRSSPWVRVVRWSGTRAIAEVAHTDAEAARAAWNGAYTQISGTTVSLRTHATWGTLRKAKKWTRAADG
jgi:RNase P/RNase MRP subunit POP5